MEHGLWVLVGGLFIISLIRDRAKTGKALRMAWIQFKGLLPMLIAMVLFLGMVRVAINPDLIARLIGPDSGIAGVISGLTIGSVILLPGFVAFPLAAGFLKAGAGYPQVAGFIAALMGVGISTAPVEIKYFGLKLTVMRNLLCLLAAAVFVTVIWGIGL